MSDITKRIHAQEALKNSERRLADMINFLPDATFAIDRRGNVIAWNRAMEEMTGVKSGDIVGKGDYEYALHFYGTRRPMLIDLVLRPDEVIKKKYAFVHHMGKCLVTEAVTTMNGKKIWLWGKAGPIYDHRGDVIGVIESIRDLTDRKKAKDALLERRTLPTAGRECTGYPIPHSTYTNS